MILIFVCTEPTVYNQCYYHIRPSYILDWLASLFFVNKKKFIKKLNESFCKRKYCLKLSQESSINEYFHIFGTLYIYISRYYFYIMNYEYNRYTIII